MDFGSTLVGPLAHSLLGSCSIPCGSFSFGYFPRVWPKQEEEGNIMYFASRREQDRWKNFRCAGMLNQELELRINDDASLVNDYDNFETPGIRCYAQMIH